MLTKVHAASDSASMVRIISRSHSIQRGSSVSTIRSSTQSTRDRRLSRAHCLINNVTGELTVRSGAAIPNRIGIADGRTDQHGYAARDHGGGGRPLSISGADG